MIVLPTFDQFMEPLLRVLAAAEGPLRAGEAYERVADLAGLTEEQRAELLPSGRQPTYKNRIGWAHDRLKRAGFSRSVKRGHWQVTEEGRNLLHRAAGIPPELLQQLAFQPDETPLAQKDEGESATEEEQEFVPTESKTPEERLQTAYERSGSAFGRNCSSRCCEQAPRSSSAWFSTC